MKAILNGDLFEAEEVKISAISAGVYYGAGCFETFRSYSGKFLHLDKHFGRLQRGLRWLGVPEDYEINSDELRNKIRSLVAENGLANKDARVRIQVILREPAGYQIPDNLEVDRIITAEPIKAKEEPVNLCTVPTRTIPFICRPPELKLSNMLHYRQAFRQAQLKDCDDGLMLNRGGFISETSISNIFWIKGNRIYTPSAACDILPGIMRNVVIKLLNRMDSYEILEGEYQSPEIDDADQVWLTNSVRGIRWVKEIDGQEYSTSSDFRTELERAFESYKKEHLE